MSGAIAQALETAAHKIGQALGHDAAGAVTKLHHTTADNLAASSAAHVEHDTQAAAKLEAAANHDTTIHDPHGGDEATRVPARDPIATVTIDDPLVELKAGTPRTDGSLRCSPGARH